MNSLIVLQWIISIYGCIEVKAKCLHLNHRLVNDVAFTCTSATLVCQQFDGSNPDVEFHSTTGIYEFYLFNTTFQSKFGYDVTVTPETASASTPYTAQIINLETNEVVSSIENVTGTQSVDVAFGRGTNNPLEVGEVHRLAVKIITNTTFSFDLSIDTEYSYLDTLAENLVYKPIQQHTHQIHLQ